ncbi:MAG: UDP-N-acetylglucosamine 1-carboxyvinyltransferase [Ruminococcus sp.]|nr:UDP-N-acetylglucosamine 1-carboxyvinyltransferase [Ruminococcus sp.]MDD7670451.1 UDP-N-acetylglucosamine 1-carboxyvinyltransferase [Ruminococcus sp.]
MERFIINGGKRLSGKIEVSGMKNAALPIIFSTILVEDRCIIENIPEIRDVTTALEIITAMGARVRMLDRTTVEIDTTGIVCGSAPYELARSIRASYYILGAELGRFGMTTSAFPGGCNFITRPIDLHIKGFEALGATVSIDEGSIHAFAKDGLKANSIYLDIESVGATINIILAAVKAEGLTIIDNAAREPHIVDLANFLNSCGANISGAGTDVIKIRGVKSLHGVSYAIIPDMIEAGTYMIAAAATHSVLTVANIIPKHLESITAKLEEMGVSVVEDDESVVVDGRCSLSRIRLKALPYPGFPTDMQPQMCVLLCLANGVSTITDSVWDNRFRYTGELARMGANITVEGKTATVVGGKLRAAGVKAVDLRAGAAMVIAGLAAEGETTIDDVYHIERGYERMVEKLNAVGADIRRVDVRESKEKAV